MVELNVKINYIHTMIVGSAVAGGGQKDCPTKNKCIVINELSECNDLLKESKYNK